MVLQPNISLENIGMITTGQTTYIWLVYGLRQKSRNPLVFGECTRSSNFSPIWCLRHVYCVLHMARFGTIQNACPGAILREQLYG